MAWVVDADVTPISEMLKEKKAAVSLSGLKLLEDGHRLEPEMVHCLHLRISKEPFESPSTCHSLRCVAMERLPEKRLVQQVMRDSISRSTGRQAVRSRTREPLRRRAFDYGTGGLGTQLALSLGFPRSDHVEDGS
jgi:hypothetical protein